MGKNKKLIITKIKSTIGRPETQERTLKALGIKKIGKTVEHNDTPDIRGMVEKVKHLVKVEEAQ